MLGLRRGVSSLGLPRSRTSLGGVAAVLGGSVACGSIEAHRDAADCVDQPSKAVKVYFHEMLESDIEMSFNRFDESRCSGLGG